MGSKGAEAGSVRLREIGAVLLIGVSTAFLAAERRSRDQGIQWIAGSIGGGFGLLVVYYFGQLRP